MLFLLGGIVVLGGFLLLVYLFVNADPVRLARNLKWTGIGIAAVAVVALLLFPPAREFARLLFPLAMSMPLLARFRNLIDRFRAPRGGQSSTVTTEYPAHDPRPRHRDDDRDRIARPICRAADRGDGGRRSARLVARMPCADEESARLVEAYLDRLHPDWRDELAGGRTGSAGVTAAQPGPAEEPAQRGPQAAT